MIHCSQRSLFQRFDLKRLRLTKIVSAENGCLKLSVYIHYYDNAAIADLAER